MQEIVDESMVNVSDLTTAVGKFQCECDQVYREQLFVDTLIKKAYNDRNGSYTFTTDCGVKKMCLQRRIAGMWEMVSKHLQQTMVWRTICSQRLSAGM